MLEKEISKEVSKEGTSREVPEEEKEILQSLGQFIGTTEYYKIGTWVIATEGIKYLCDRCQCYWIMGIIDSVFPMLERKYSTSFIVWKVEVNTDKSFQVSAWSDTPYKSTLLYKQRGEFTDFPIKDFEFFQIKNVVLLKSEY